MQFALSVIQAGERITLMRAYLAGDAESKMHSVTKAQAADLIIQIMAAHWFLLYAPCAQVEIS